jgi:hypothetical protein
LAYENLKCLVNQRRTKKCVEPLGDQFSALIGRIRLQRELGGMLNYYYREAGILDVGRVFGSKRTAIQPA